jgi:hypothetical protein
MNYFFRALCGVVAGIFVFAGCAEQRSGDMFTVRQIESSPQANGAVRVKLTTNGDLAEADESLLVAYVKVIAVHEATRQQRRLAEARARAIYSRMTAGQKSRKARYLAVSTEKSVDAKGRKFSGSVMIWDTQSEAIVGANVYDIASPPSVGQTAQFDTYSAEYVGAGL